MRHMFLLFAILLGFSTTQLSAQRHERHNPHKSQNHYKPEYMSDADFEVLYRIIKNKSFKSDKMQLLEVGCLDSRFSCKQCMQIMSIFTFDDDKIAVLQLMSDRIVNFDSAHKLINSLTFDSNIRKAEQILFNKDR